MSENAQVVLGAVYVFGIPLLILLVLGGLARLIGRRVHHNQALRQRETHMLRQAYDDELTDQVAAKWGLDPSDFRHRR
ncbi:hypothetical protein ACU639_17800 [Streptomyces cynarae]|uniref:hypothetical protein n=1 Tax=Streptomyces cynarae TaxID=2981134 RepID=UPI00406CEFC4